VAWLLVVGAVLLSACAGPGGGGKHSVRKDCSQADIAAGECVPGRVIEISENIGVDPEVRRDFNTAIGLLEQEKYPEAIRLLRAVTGRTSRFTAPFINLGIAYARTGELEKAEENLKKALEINRRHPVANNELAMVYRKTGRFQEAREHYERTVNMYPEFLPARINLGVLCDIYMQDLDCALDQYEAYLSRFPDDEQVKIWVADVKSRI
jgi:tetratricopeptide (TPR) repeat protein